MKRRTLLIAAPFAITGFGCIAGLVFSIVEGYDSKARRYYGNKKRVAAMTRLYEGVAALSPPGSGLIELDPIEFSTLKFPKTRKIPQSMLEKGIREFDRSEDFPFVALGDVLAHYDAGDKLVAIEFYGSRLGCFVHRDPDLEIRRNHRTQIRIARGTPNITAWASGAD